MFSFNTTCSAVRNMFVIVAGPSCRRRHTAYTHKGLDDLACWTLTEHGLGVWWQQVSELLEPLQAQQPHMLVGRQETLREHDTEASTHA